MLTCGKRHLVIPLYLLLLLLLLNDFGLLLRGFLLRSFLLRNLLRGGVNHLDFLLHNGWFLRRRIVLILRRGALALAARFLGRLLLLDLGLSLLGLSVLLVVLSRNIFIFLSVVLVLSIILILTL